MSCFEISAARIPEGSNQYAFAAPSQDLGLSAAFPADVRVQVDLQRRGRQYLVDGEVSTVGRFVCDRCLTEFERDTGGSFRVLFAPEGVSLSPGQEDDELRIIPADTMTIVLDDEVRQSLELAVPPKLLCTEACKGLCPRCGKNLNDGQCSCTHDDTDPRWEPLQRLGRS